MLGLNLENVVEAEEPVGIHLLEYYISLYLYDRPHHLGIREKRALSLCCKKFKALFDAAITSADISFRGTTRLSSDNNLIEIDWRPPGREEEEIKSLRSLDLICQRFPSLKDITVMEDTMLNDVLPESIGQLTSLTKLEICPVWEGFVALPSSFSQLTVLKNLVMKASTTEAIAPLQHCLALESLKLLLPNTLGISKVPEFIGTLTLLTNLDITFQGKRGGDGGGAACSLPDTLGNLKQLKKLQLLLNTESLPKSIGDMCALKSVKITLSKGLKRLPESFGNLTALGELVLNDCDDLEALPDSLGNLKSLSLLSISHCTRLSELPSTIGGLQSLKILFLENCGLVTLPDSIGDLKSLGVLYMDNFKDLRTLPESISRLTGLIHLRLDRCEQLRTPPVETLLQHFGKTLTYRMGELRIENGVEVVEEEEEEYETSDNSYDFDLGQFSDDSDASHGDDSEVGTTDDDE